jgi:hypothetical protein
MLTYAKAIIAALVAGLSSVAVALEDGHITAQEGVTAAIATLVALGAVAAIPNKGTPLPPPPPPAA